MMGCVWKCALCVVIGERSGLRWPWTGRTEATCILSDYL